MQIKPLLLLLLLPQLRNGEPSYIAKPVQKGNFWHRVFPATKKSVVYSKGIRGFTIPVEEKRHELGEFGPAPKYAPYESPGRKWGLSRDRISPIRSLAILARARERGW